MIPWVDGPDHLYADGLRGWLTRGECTNAFGYDLTIAYPQPETSYPKHEYGFGRREDARAACNLLVEPLVLRGEVNL